NNFSRQSYDLTKVYINEIIRIHFYCYDINLKFFIFLYFIVSKNFIPYVQQITKISIHVLWIFCMVYTMMRRRKYNVIQKTQAPVFHNIFTHMNKSSPRSINKHN